MLKAKAARQWMVTVLRMRVSVIVTSDVEVTDQRTRKVVAFHCLAAFAFNIGVLAFTVNLLASGGG